MTASKLTRAMLAPLMIPHAAYEIDVGWDSLEGHLAREMSAGLDLDPDFQRGHVWTMAQRVAWVEYVLTGGEIGKTLLVAHIGKRAHDANAAGKINGYCLVDGKQRLTTARMLLRGDLRVFPRAECPEGYTWSEIDDGVKRLYIGRFQWRLVVVDSRADLLRLYLRLNAGGTPHAPEEIARVSAMLAEEKG